MKRTEPKGEVTLTSEQMECRECGSRLRVVYHKQRMVVTMKGLQRLRLVMKRCLSPGCRGHSPVIRPEEVGKWVLPESEIGLDVIAQIGAWRYQDQRSVPQMHQLLQERGVSISQRSVTNALYRYDELVATRVRDATWGKAHLKASGVVMAIDGLQPDVGHEVLWVIRDTVTGTILLARSLLSGTEDDLVPLLTEVRDRLTEWKIPIVGAISDGQHSVRNALATALPEVPCQVCQFHYLREAAKPMFEADRHAKKELKKALRGVRPIERDLEGKPDAPSLVAHEYCNAVRAALTDDARAPLEAAGLRLQNRLQAIEESLHRVEQKGG